MSEEIIEETEDHFNFIIEGGFRIDGKFKPEKSWDYQTVGFKLPDGRTARLCCCLEIESEDGKAMEYITSEKEMDTLGFRCLDYGRLEFHESPE